MMRYTHAGTDRKHWRQGRLVRGFLLLSADYHDGGVSSKYHSKRPAIQADDGSLARCEDGDLEAENDEAEGYLDDVQPQLQGRDQIRIPL